MRRPLSTRQAVILTLLWVSICYIILVGAERIDGPLILTVVISGALVFIPLIKSLRKDFSCKHRKTEQNLKRSNAITELK